MRITVCKEGLKLVFRGRSVCLDLAEWGVCVCVVCMCVHMVGVCVCVHVVCVVCVCIWRQCVCMWYVCTYSDSGGVCACVCVCMWCTVCAHMVVVSVHVVCVHTVVVVCARMVCGMCAHACVRAQHSCIPGEKRRMLWRGRKGTLCLEPLGTSTRSEEARVLCQWKAYFAQQDQKSN